MFILGNKPSTGELLENLSLCIDKLAKINFYEVLKFNLSFLVMKITMESLILIHTWQVCNLFVLS